jgi:hypothetical protein
MMIVEIPGGANSRRKTLEQSKSRLEAVVCRLKALDFCNPGIDTSMRRIVSDNLLELIRPW